MMPLYERHAATGTVSLMVLNAFIISAAVCEGSEASGDHHLAITTSQPG